MQTLTLEDELTIFTAAELKPQLLNFLNSENELEIDLSKIVEMDTAGLQLLILIKREANKASKKLHFIFHSKTVLEILELTNLTASFGDQVVLARNEG
ncbi:MULTISPECIES: STAS domain-containing protein [Methylomonas]|uniref:STAS domain-containing protein n=1 Tax=Methylomonas TaxID=416 RepID=UPI0012327EC6|nr:STAS domain-containing protein [Methylomonas rhizoryzae]